MNAKAWILLGGLVGGLGVAAGALGAHGLKSALRPGESAATASSEEWDRYQKRIENFDVAARYQMYHAPALVLVGVLLLRRQCLALQSAGWLFLAGVVLFSGMLYGWVFTQIPWMVHVVPIGGTAYILGWLALAYGGWALVPGDGQSE